MDEGLLIDSKDCFYTEDFLEELLSKECKWTSLLDAADASPSEILADAAPMLMPPISPGLSIKSSQSSSNSDSGSEDDSKNSSSSTSARQSSQSPYDWLSNFDDEPPNNLNLEDIELFLQKTAPDQPTPLPNDIVPSNRTVGRNRPVVAIENGVIKGIERKPEPFDGKATSPHPHKDTAYLQNFYFKVVNENSHANTEIDGRPKLSNGHVQLVVEQKKVPSILKRSTHILTKPKMNVISTESAKEPQIAISPPPIKTLNINNDNPVNGATNNIIVNGNAVFLKRETTTPVVQNCAISSTESDFLVDTNLDVSNFTEAELRALKKRQRMIKNRESACQSRQKKKEYVTALEQRLLEAQQEIARLQLENKLLRDQLQNGERVRKIPKLDASLLIPKKNIAVLFAMVFMVSLNWNVLGWNSKPFVGPTTSNVGTRHLLWTEENSTDMSSENDLLSNSTFGPDCQNMTIHAHNFVNINQTESLRIAGDLSRWIGGGKTLNWTYDEPRKKRNVFVNEEKINGGLLETYRLYNKLNLESGLIDFLNTKNNVKNIRDKARLRRIRRSKEVEFADNAVLDYETLYGKPIRKSVDDFNMDDFGEWNALLQALQRRDDTFYVVGVGKGEHLLLPAVSHNVTRPPKMALILPARTGNDSVMNDHVTLMQIDCSVVNTTLVKLKSDALPESLRKPSRKSEKPISTSTSDNGKSKDTIDSSLADVLKNSSNNVSNYPLNKDQINHDGKDIFSDYMFSKNDEKDSNNNNFIKKIDKINHDTIKTKNIKSSNKNT